MKAVYWKGEQKRLIDVEENLSSFIDKLFTHSNPASQLENMIKYGFNFGGSSVMGINDLLRQIRRKKLDEMKKNISDTYKDETSKVQKVKDTELNEVNSKISQKISELERQYNVGKMSDANDMGRRMSTSVDVEESESDDSMSDERSVRGDKNMEGLESIKEQIDKLLKDMLERNEMLSDVPEHFSYAMDRLKRYDETKGFMSEEAKRMFDELMRNFDDIRRLGEFLKKHPYGFKEGEPLTLPEAMEVVDKFEQLEKLEEKLKEGKINDISPDVIQDVLGAEEYEDFMTISKILEVLKQSGFFVMKGNSIILTPRGVRKIGYKVLKDIFSDVRSKLAGMHSSRRSGNYEVDYEDKKRWEFGDNINIDIFSTLKNAIIQGRFDPKTGNVAVEPDDFEIYRSRFFFRTNSALLIDTSWSMSWGGKFECAKKVALALHSLISSYFPNDKLYIVAFFTVAMEIKAHELPSIELNMNDPFTNMQDAIRVARKLLKKSPGDEKQIIMITDGQPTAYCVGGRVFVEWPVMGCSPNAMRETIKEVEEATRENIKINIFMVEDNPQVEKFVEEVVRINKGRAFFTTPETLGKFLLLDFVSRKRVLIR